MEVQEEVEARVTREFRHLLATGKSFEEAKREAARFIPLDWWGHFDLEAKSFILEAIYSTPADV